MSSEWQNRMSLPVGRQITDLQIIVAALAMGALAFGVVVNTVIGPADNPVNGVLTKVGLGFGLVALVVHRIVGSIVLSKGMRGLPDDEEAARRKMMVTKYKSTIVACAIVEAGVFLNLIVYGFLEGQPISMAMAALLWFAIVIKFPLRPTLEDWMNRELRVAKEERELKAKS